MKGSGPDSIRSGSTGWATPKRARAFDRQTRREPSGFNPRLFCLWLWLFLVSPQGLSAGEIRGRVVDEKTGLPLPGSNVWVVGTQRGAAASEDGEFVLSNLPDGVYDLRITRIGYRPRIVRAVRVGPSARGSSPLLVKLQPTPVEVEPLVVSASRREQPLQDSPVSVSVVTAEDIRRRSPLDLQQALELAPGVHFVGNQINVRGSTGFNLGAGNKVLLLLDGVPVHASDTGEFNWDLIPPDEVERIEVVKGAGSALWGEAALGGVVNIITRAPSRDRLALGLSGGKYDRPAFAQWIWTDWERLRYGRIYASATKCWGPWAVRLSLARVFDTGYRQLGDSRKYSGLLHAVRTLPNGGRWATFLAYSWIRRGFFIQWKGQNHPYEVDPTELENRASVDQLSGYTRVTLPLSSRLAVNVRLSTVRTLMGSYLSRPSDFRPALGQGAEVQADWVPSYRHSVTFGLQIQRDGGSAKYFGRHRGLFVAPYVQDELRLRPALRTVLGLRYDAYHLDARAREDLLSPRVGLSWEPVPWMALRASAGAGFRAATIVERFLQVQVQNFTVRPNPDLQPEKSWTREIGFRVYPTPHWTLDGSLFRSDYRQLIEAHLDIIRGFIQFRNIPRARIQGVEASSDLSLPFRLLRTSGSATWRFSLTAVHHEELEFHDPLPYRPRRLLTSRWFLRFGSLEGEVDYRFASRIERVKVYPITDRVPMHFWDVHLGVTLGSVKIRAACRNLTNYNYAPMESNLEAPRRFELGLEWSEE
ncbi:MAG: TonB-dependent receptor [candidate division KSB1 bacterium]|nr:TonB-dependent receptor [candidate division KSB1 bacterium]